MPALTRASMRSAVEVAGPSVHTILALRTRSTLLGEWFRHRGFVAVAPPKAGGAQTTRGRSVGGIGEGSVVAPVRGGGTGGGGGGGGGVGGGGGGLGVDGGGRGATLRDRPDDQGLSAAGVARDED